jgi:formamidopyrimidine-DNA glycosylase
MPELPEVETMRRGIATIVGSRICDVRRPPSKLRAIQIKPRLDVFRRRVVGRTIAGLGRAGKRVLVELDSAERIVIEPRMTGRVLLAEPPDLAHLRVVFDLAGGSAEHLFFWDSRGLGVVQLMTPSDFERLLGPDMLGPDALLIDALVLRDRMAGSRRAIKVALLDQRVVAGVGNLYASEILHRAHLHPAIPCYRLRAADWRRLHAMLGEVLREAVELEGSTLADGTYRNASNQAGGFQSQHRVYQRAGKPCVCCGTTPIVRLVQAQRSTFFCPMCQRPRKS